MTETTTVRLLRAAFRAWPFMHGRGWILRLARLLLGHDPVFFDIGEKRFIEGDLDDWMLVWAFMCRHEKDAPFQQSLKLVPHGGVAFDVGAHVGIWSLLASRRSRVHAFEPLQADRLRAHALLDHADVVVNECAAGAENGTASFFAVYGNSGASALARRAETDVEVRTNVITLDSYAAEKKIDRVDLLKIDVEGAELLVLKGAHELLRLEPAIFFEADDQLARSFGGTTRDVKQLLAGHGYGIYRWQRSRFVPVAVDEPHGHEDLFALKARHVAQMTKP